VKLVSISLLSHSLAVISASPANLAARNMPPYPSHAKKTEINMHFDLCILLHSSILVEWDIIVSTRVVLEYFAASEPRRVGY